MTVEDNKALVSRIADDIWNRKNLAAVAEVMAPSSTFHGPQMPNGSGDREAWGRAIGMYLEAFPDSHVVYEELIASDDTVVGRWSATATHTGQLPGVDPTGKRITIGGITIYRIASGQIIEAWEQLDMLGMWQQLGVVTVPGHES